MKTTINKLQTNTEKDVVTVHFTVRKDDERQYAKVDLPEPDEENYTPYEELTEKDVLSWITGTPEHERAVFLVEKRLKEKAEIVEPPLPWGLSEKEKENNN